MAKAKTTYKIGVTDRAIFEWPEVKEWINQGHQVFLVLADNPDEFGEFDLILGPQCHMMDNTLRKYINLALQEVKDRKALTSKSKQRRDAALAKLRKDVDYAGETKEGATD